MPKGKRPVVCYSMGKVGSTSIYRAIRDQTELDCYQVHFLDPDTVVTLIKNEFSKENRKTIRQHLIDSLTVYNMISRKVPVNIISVIRNPISRNISAVFENLPRNVNSREEVMKRIADYPAGIPNHWFNSDFTTYTGFDYLSTDVDQGADHFVYRRNACNVLLIKLEAGKDRMSELISNFINEKIELALRMRQKINGIEKSMKILL